MWVCCGTAQGPPATVPRQNLRVALGWRVRVFKAARRFPARRLPRLRCISSRRVPGLSSRHLHSLTSHAPAACPWRWQVIIEGFKSYKEQTVTEAFSPKLNTVGESERCRLRFLASYPHLPARSGRQRRGQDKLLPWRVVPAASPRWGTEACAHCLRCPPRLSSHPLRPLRPLRHHARGGPTVAAARARPVVHTLRWPGSALKCPPL